MINSWVDWCNQSPEFVSHNSDFSFSLLWESSERINSSSSAGASHKIWLAKCYNIPKKVMDQNLMIRYVKSKELAIDLKLSELEDKRKELESKIENGVVMLVINNKKS